MRSKPKSMCLRSSASCVYVQNGIAACMNLPQNSVCQRRPRSVFSRNGAVM